jgi:hypothetical protein
MHLDPNLKCFSVKFICLQGFESTPLGPEVVGRSDSPKNLDFLVQELPYIQWLLYVWPSSGVRAWLRTGQSNLRLLSTRYP